MTLAAASGIDLLTLLKAMLVRDPDTPKWRVRFVEVHLPGSTATAVVFECLQEELLSVAAFV